MHAFYNIGTYLFRSTNNLSTDDEPKTLALVQTIILYNMLKHKCKYNLKTFLF